VLDGVGMVWARLLQDLLEEVRGRPRLMLAAARSGRNTPNAGVIRSLAVATVVINRSCSLLNSLLVPLPIALGAIPGVHGGASSPCPLAAALGRVKLGCLAAGGVLCGSVV
jgi:hypothetical protein